MPEAAAHRLQETVDEIVGYQARTRWWRWGTAILAVVALGLGVFAYVQNNAIQDQANALHKSQLANCAVGNDYKAKNLALWHDLFALSAANNNATHQKVPPSTVRFLTEFLHDVDTTFVPLNCVKAYPAG